MYSLLYANPPRSLKTIHLLLDDENEDDDGQSEGTEEENDNGDDQRTQSVDVELRELVDEPKE